MSGAETELTGAAGQPPAVAGPPGSARWRRRWWWLTPVLAAVVLVAGLAVTTGGSGTGTARGPGAGGPFADAGTASSPPPFYVSVDFDDQILVHSTSTGRLTAMTPEPPWFSGGLSADTAVAAEPSGRMFAVVLNDWDSARTRIFTFGVTSSGRISGFAARSVRVPGMTSLSAALSPGGNELALAGIADAPRSAGVGATVAGPPRLFVVSLRTGEVATWRGPASSGSEALIQDLSWAMSGQALSFLMTFCRGGRIDAVNVVCPGSWPTGQAWAAAVRPGAAGLSVHQQSAVLPAGASQAVAVPGPALIVLRVAENLTISEYTVGGKLIRTLYTGMPRAGLETAYLSVDGSGRYVILNEDRSTVFGWVSHGRLSQLSTRGHFGPDELLSSAW